MNECATAEYVRSQGREAMRRLIRGDRFRSRRILSDLSSLRLPLSSLEAAAEGMASHAPVAIVRAAGPLRQVALSGLKDAGMVLIATSFYGRTARKYPRMVLRDAELLVSRGRTWWVSDLVATRMLAPMLAHHGLLTLCALGQWAKFGCPFLRRAVAVTVRYGFHRRLTGFCGRADASALVFVLGLIRDDENEAVHRTVAQAVRALCAFDPELGLRTVRTWLEQGGAASHVLCHEVWPTLTAPQREELDALRSSAN